MSYGVCYLVCLQNLNAVFQGLEYTSKITEVKYTYPGHGTGVQHSRKKPTYQLPRVV
jgi:hypothetical protein